MLNLFQLEKLYIHLFTSGDVKKIINAKVNIFYQYNLAEYKMLRIILDYNSMLNLFQSVKPYIHLFSLEDVKKIPNDKVNIC